MSTLNGAFGLLMIPDANTVRIVGHVLEDRRVARRLEKAAYVVRPEGVHVTLYQARTFRDLPVEVARRLVGKLNQLVVHNRMGKLLFHLFEVGPYRDNDRFLFWNAHEPFGDERLQLAHGMSVALAAWVEIDAEDEHAFERRISDLPETERYRRRGLYENERLFGHTLVGEEYLPHITLAADPDGFGAIKPFEEPFTASAARVVFARMGEWGKIDEILF